MVTRKHVAIGGSIGAAGIIAATVMFAAPWEGGQRLHAFLDPVGVPTICLGHTEGVKMGDTATPEQCMTWAKQDMAGAYQHVTECIHVPLTDGPLLAFTDAAYNAGRAVVCGSTLQRLANAGYIDHACLQLVDAKGSDGLPTGWTKAGGKILPGLIARREAETIVCLKGIGALEATK